jgi:hypothetical protein
MTAEELQGHEFITVPFSDNMKLAAGGGGEIPFTWDEKNTKIVVHGPSLDRSSSAFLQAFRVGGDSMEPVIGEKGIVIVDKSENDPLKIKPGKIYVLCWELDLGECALKFSIGLKLASYLLSNQPIKPFMRLCIGL